MLATEVQARAAAQMDTLIDCMVRNISAQRPQGFFVIDARCTALTPSHLGHTAQHMHQPQFFAL